MSIEEKRKRRAKKILNSLLFNISKFIRLMREKRGARGVRAVSEEVGISHMTYYNIEQGRVIPTLESFIRIVLWMNSDAQLFVITGRLTHSRSKCCHPVNILDA